MAWNLSLSGKAGIITGAASGIGRAAALKIAEMGAKILLVDLNQEGLAALAAEIKAAGYPEATPLAMDCSDEAAIKNAVAKCVSELGSIDFLVNSAGILGKRGSLLDMDPRKDWDPVIAINLRGPFIFCREALSHMKAKGAGSIVNVASLAGRTCSLLGGPQYTTSKHALVGFSRHIAREFASFGVRINAFCPGATYTPMITSAAQEDEQARVAANIPRGKLGSAEEQGACIAFLVSDASSNMTGACLDSNGGNLMI